MITAASAQPPTQPPALPAAIPRAETPALPEAGLSALREEDIEHLAERAARWWRRVTRTGWLGFLGPPTLVAIAATLTRKGPPLPDWFLNLMFLIPVASVAHAVLGNLVARRLLADECRALGYDAQAGRRVMRAWDRARQTFWPRLTHGQKRAALVRCLQAEREEALSREQRSLSPPRGLRRWLRWPLTPLRRR